ncbi:hypothetical protein L0B53_14915 [Vibrio sp. SS-MA-C1-2]|uniref:hypothetical protein n=1 Tax=Vibrio sp. SS-MA-C1-2 TaxID=2908646 RepID=UPI001F1BB3A4|nr:hypothetical protein [Vibrio sp. SS-MA-C1-2]UJF18299.1 hypothetical protein L0B53_14915 [Vibrio sp. SS-MA-C1-2]
MFYIIGVNERRQQPSSFKYEGYINNAEIYLNRAGVSLKSDNLYQVNFDTLRDTIEPMVNGMLLFDYDCNSVNLAKNKSMKDKAFTLIQLTRPNVQYTVLQTTKKLFLYSKHFQCYNASQENRQTTLIITALNDIPICFNGFWLKETQIGLVSNRSHVPFSLIVPANCLIMIAELNIQDNKLTRFSDAMVPLNINNQYINKLRGAAKIVYQTPSINPGIGGTEALLNLLYDLVQQLPPLRPQSLKGPSRLSRKDLIPKVLNHMENDESQLLTLNTLADNLNISSKTINLLFKHYVGIAPKRASQLIKLFKFRKVLQQSDIHSVLDATVLANIDHWSRYSIRYQQLFLEKPNQTLKTANSTST